MFLWVCLLVFIFFDDHTSGHLLCLPGTRLHTTKDGFDVCRSCENRVEFISDRQHSYRKCQPCTQIKDPDLEILVSECNRTHDTVILCKPGYYRIKARNSRDKDECVKCRECAFPTRECQGYHDTMCCPPNYDAVLSGDDYLCKVRPVVCGPGHYFKEISDECLPCPDGTYMNDNVHTYTQCLKCGVLSGELTHAVIIRSCNKTSPTLFGCEPGYFRDPGKESLQIGEACSSCQKCDQQIKECDMFHDTICGLQDCPTLVNHTVCSVTETGEMSDKQIDNHQETLTPETTKHDDMDNCIDQTACAYKAESSFNKNNSSGKSVNETDTTQHFSDRVRILLFSVVVIMFGEILF